MTIQLFSRMIRSLTSFTAVFGAAALAGLIARAVPRPVRVRLLYNRRHQRDRLLQRVRRSFSAATLRFCSPEEKVKRPMCTSTLMCSGATTKRFC